MNNKGQSLVMFVIFIPLILILGALVVDVGRYAYEINKVNNLNKECIRYALKNIESDPKDKTILLLYKNDSEINNYNLDINIEEKQVSLYIKKTMNLLFTKVVGKEVYIIKSNYKGYIKDDVIYINRKGDISG